MNKTITSNTYMVIIKRGKSYTELTLKKSKLTKKIAKVASLLQLYRPTYWQQYVLSKKKEKGKGRENYAFFFLL